MSDEIRDAVARVLMRFVRVRARDAADAVLALPQIREALEAQRLHAAAEDAALLARLLGTERERDEARAALAAAQAENERLRRVLSNATTKIQQGLQVGRGVSTGYLSEETRAAMRGVLGLLLAAAPEVKP